MKFPLKTLAHTQTNEKCFNKHLKIKSSTVQNHNSNKNSNSSNDNGNNKNERLTIKTNSIENNNNNKLHPFTCANSTYLLPCNVAALNGQNEMHT